MSKVSQPFISDSACKWCQERKVVRSSRESGVFVAFYMASRHGCIYLLVQIHTQAVHVKSIADSC